MSWSSLDSFLDQIDGRNKPKKPVDAVTEDTNAIVAFLPRHNSPKSSVGTRVEHTKARVQRISLRNGPAMGKRNKIAPKPGDSPPSEEDIEMQKLVARGVDLEHVDDEEQQWEVMENIRALPCPLRVKSMLRDKLLSGSVQSLSCCASWKYHMSRSWTKFKWRASEIWHVIELWGGSFRSIEGHHGTGVLSYFVFLRWLFGLNLLIFLLMFCFVSIPHFFLPVIDYSATSTDNSVNLSYYCTNQYNVSVSTDAAQLVLDFFQGTGYMEQTQVFYGHYWGSQFLTGTGVTNTFVYNVPLAYYLVSIVCLLVSLFLMARYTANSFRTSILDEHDTGFEYCNKVFGSWDYSFSDEDMATLKHKSIYYDIASDLTEERFQKERAEKLSEGNKRCRLYTVRFLINMFVLCCLGGGGYLIFYVTTWSTGYAASNSDAMGNQAYLLLLVQYLPSVTITVLNAAIPLIFGIVVKAEEYTEAFVVKITLIRTVFLRLASLAVLVVSLYTKISCQPRDSCQTTQAPCSVINCWETYVGQQMYKLIILNFLVTVVKIFLVEFPRRLIVTKCKAKLFEKIGPPEFQIPQNVLDLVYTQTVCWLGFFFSPLLPAMVVIHLFIVFYCKKLSALLACEPSKRPYRAARSNSFFMIVLLLAFFLCSVPVVYTMSVLAPSKSCGPFRIYAQIYTVLQVTVVAWPDALESVYNILTSSAVAVVLIVVLGLLVYYCSAMKGAHKEMNKVLKHQLTLEGQDIQFLMSRIQQLTGEKAPLTKSRRNAIGKRGTSGITAKEKITMKSDRQQTPSYGRQTVTPGTRQNSTLAPQPPSQHESPHPNQPLDEW